MTDKKSFPILEAGLDAHREQMAFTNLIRAVLTEGKLFTAEEAVDLESRINQIEQLSRKRKFPDMILSVPVPGAAPTEITPLISIEFVKLVDTMREAQRVYFKNRDRAVLELSKQLEKNVDLEINVIKSKIKGE